ncbi:folate receptor gamma-like isoform X3 [Mya arenaria]|uniref:folate receptor gamma-like isoform X2 n=1 Tax=Mya arenaria TaxID=6604 RepID=UPI0022E15514|nr:folate receptor gamma-like isoform X2 [Mya arenaria]XP_052793668.1 folate receptor gamma-like isoform X3 [Mya arenaria]
MDMMDYTLLLVLGISYVCGEASRLSELTSADDYMNICMDGVSHKGSPGPEDKLFDKCTPWKDRSCCTSEITSNIHMNTSWYNLDWSHCPQQLSPQCRARFTQDLCFYECSPNVGPWLVKVDGMKIRNERFVDVPLCHSECDAWWEDCRDDFTCVENWSRHFNWTSDGAKCPANTECVTFETMFKNSTNFCEKVWDHSWKVVNDSNPEGCFVMWWQEDTANPNYDVAYRKAQAIVSGAPDALPKWFHSLCLCVVNVLVLSFTKAGRFW